MSAILIIVLTAILCLFLHIMGGKRWVSFIAILGLICALIVNSMNTNELWSSYIGMFNSSSFSKIFSGACILFTILIVLLNLASPGLEEDTYNGDKLGLVLFSLSGAIILFIYSNLTMLFLGIEILSIPLYVIASSNKEDLHSNEAGLKYFLMGSFATGLLLFGMALLFGATNSLDIMVIGDYFSNNEPSAIALSGALLVCIGFLFKIGAVPFHFWSPDVYEGTPTLWTTFMATVVKLAAFGAFFKMYILMGDESGSPFHKIMVIITASTLLLGGFSALVQDSAKRMMAYSSIVNAGFVLLLFLAIDSHVLEYLGYYLIAYGLATIGVFTGLIYLSNHHLSNGFDSFKGMSRYNPSMAIGITICLLSLAGIPMTAGFFGKFYVLNSVFKDHLWLAMIALIISILGIVYYFRIFYSMYFQKENIEPIQREKEDIFANFVVAFCAIGIIVAGIYPDIIIDLFN